MCIGEQRGTAARRIGRRKRRCGRARVCMSVASVARKVAHRHRFRPRSGTRAHDPAHKSAAAELAQCGMSARSPGSAKFIEHCAGRLCRASPATANKQTLATLSVHAAAATEHYTVKTLRCTACATALRSTRQPLVVGALAWRTVAMVGASAARRVGCCESGRGSSSDAPTIRMLPIESAVPLRTCSSSAATNSSSLSPRKLTCRADASGPLSCGSPQASRLAWSTLCDSE